MNQEQNNLNLNNFNTQGSNGIPNNQPLNNQSFNQQPINPQPQPTQSFQQPKNKMNIEQPTPQLINNTFESGNANNQNFNNKPPKKMNLGLIIGITAAVVVVAVITALLIGKNNSSGSSNSLFESNVEKITKEDIKNYDLKSLARWGNVSLGISYLIPTSSDTALFSTNGSKSFSYLHGHSFIYNNGYYIYVEKSLEGNTNLNTLPIDINTEKNSEKYKYESSYKTYDLNEIVLTEKVVIDKLETVYFESNEFDTRVLSGISMVDAKAKYLGYSFKYNDSYYSVYGQIGYTQEESDTEKKELLKKYLHYVISSFDKYNDESFYELDNNFNLKSLYDGGSVNKSYKELNNDEKQFVINHYGTHTNNGVYRSRYVDLITIDKNLISWDGSLDSIYNSVLNSSSYQHLLEFKQETCGGAIGKEWICASSNILEETKETINEIEMKKYVIEYTSLKGTNYQVVYTFKVNENPYLFQFKIDSYYEESDNLTNESKEIFKKSTDIIASTLIRTIRFIVVDNSLSELDTQYHYQNYIN